MFGLFLIILFLSGVLTIYSLITIDDTTVGVTILQSIIAIIAIGGMMCSKDINNTPNNTQTVNKVIVNISLLILNMDDTIKVFNIKNEHK